MPIFNIAPTEAVSIPQLLRLTLRFIYEEHKMSLSDINLMKFSINFYANKIREIDEKRAERYLILPGDEEGNDSQQRDSLKWMAALLLAKETNTLTPRLKRRILMVRLGMLDWRKFHKLPEAYTAEGLEKAQIMYEKYKEKNPEQEDMGTPAA